MDDDTRIRDTRRDGERTGERTCLCCAYDLYKSKGSRDDY